MFLQMSLQVFLAVVYARLTPHWPGIRRDQTHKYLGVESDNKELGDLRVCTLWINYMLWSSVVGTHHVSPWTLITKHRVIPTSRLFIMSAVESHTVNMDGCTVLYNVCAQASA